MYKKIAILSNITMDIIKQKLSKQYDIYLPSGYDSWLQEVLNPNATIYTEKFDAIILLLDGVVSEKWDNKIEIEEGMAFLKQGVEALVSRINNTPIFISTIDFRETRIKALCERHYRISMQYDWYQFAQKTAEQKKNVYIYDLVDKIASIGREQFYSDKMWYMSGMPYSRVGILEVCKFIKQLLKTCFETPKKVLVLDLDNTLWGGVIGEDGINGIVLSDHNEGQRFYDFQKQILNIQKMGIVLAIVSKNNIDDAEQVFSNHPYMLLYNEHFVAKKINWEPKPKNIIELEKELNITEGGFVFIDDNPAEREAVKSACPEAIVPDFPLDTTILKKFAEEIYNEYFLRSDILDEDLKKTQMYKNEIQRKAEQKQSLTLDSYLEKLELCADIHLMREDEIDRVTQLCNKTNQFNLTTKRYSRDEIVELSKDVNKKIFVAYLDDKYGQSGLVSLLIVNELEDCLEIDTFLMSCRIMGRNLEKVMLNELVKMYATNNAVSYIKGTYLASAYISTV